jgi:cobaltochelatase CobT
MPEWYRPGSAPWFEAGLGEKQIHPSAMRSDRETIVLPPRGDPVAYRSLWLEVQREAGFLISRLVRLLQEEAYLRYAGRFRSGQLVMNRLWKQRLADYRLFQRREAGGRQSTAVSLLVDESASMQGREKSRLAAKAAVLLGETLSRLQVPLEIIGYTTAEFEAREAMRLGLTPAYQYRTTRCSPLQHRLYKSFSEPYRHVRSRLSDIQPRHNNWDDEHLLFAYRRIRSRPEPGKLVVVIGDGQPNGDADHLTRAAAAVERLGCRVIGIGIGEDFVQRIYRNAIVVSDFHQLGEALLSILAREIGRGMPAHAPVPTGRGISSAQAGAQ